MSEPSDSNVSNLTEDQKEFLRQCEKDFANRFTDSDPEYVKVRDRTKSVQPIEHPWNPFSFRSYDMNRDRGRFRDRDHRDYRDRDGRRNHYRRDNYHPRYDNRRRDYNRYNRSPYQSSYY